MDEQNDVAPAEWNPLAEIAPQSIPLKASGGRAHVVYRRWSGRERLAYEDAITEKLMTTDQAGEDTVRLGSMRLFGASLTIVGSVGFPPAADGRTFLTGTREQREADLLAITDPDTSNEIRATALKVQPLPSADADTAGEGDEGEDPSRTPSTPAENGTPDR